MKLNHINLTVTDVQAASDFLVKYFGLRDMGGNAGMGFLTDDDHEWGFVLTLMKGKNKTGEKYPGSFHIGFFIDSEETVDEIHRRLKKDGFDVPPPERNNHAYGFYVNAPGGFTIELGAWFLKQIGEECWKDTQSMKLHELAYFTDNVQGMTDFYRWLLGTDPVAKSDDMAIFMSGGTKIFIHRNYPSSEGELPANNHIAFAVEDVDASCEALTQHGLILEVPPQDYYWGRSAYLRDPDGHQVEITKGPESAK